MASDFKGGFCSPDFAKYLPKFIEEMKLHYSTLTCVQISTYVHLVSVGVFSGFFPGHIPRNEGTLSEKHGLMSFMLDCHLRPRSTAAGLVLPPHPPATAGDV